MKRRTLWGAGALGAAAALCVATLPATASSHREAPAITEDPVADITDFYMFASPDRPDTTTLVLNAGPMEEPLAGARLELAPEGVGATQQRHVARILEVRFADDARMTV